MKNASPVHHDHLASHEVAVGEQKKTNVPMRSSDVCRCLMERSLSWSSVNAFGAFWPSCSTKPGAFARSSMDVPFENFAITAIISLR